MICYQLEWFDWSRFSNRTLKMATWRACSGSLCRKGWSNICVITTSIRSSIERAANSFVVADCFHVRSNTIANPSGLLKVRSSSTGTRIISCGLQIPWYRFELGHFDNLPFNHSNRYKSYSWCLPRGCSWLLVFSFLQELEHVLGRPVLRGAWLSEFYSSAAYGGLLGIAFYLKNTLGDHEWESFLFVGDYCLCLVTGWRFIVEALFIMGVLLEMLIPVFLHRFMYALAYWSMTFAS